MSSVRALLLAVEPVGPDALGGDVYDRFKAEQDTLIVPVIDEEGRPVGIIERNAFFLRMAAEFGRALYARRPIHLVMDPNPLVVEADAPIADFMGRMLTERPSDLLRGFILAEDGRYIGVGTALGLMQHAHQHAQLTMRQIEKLAHYDPLTGLPNRALFQKQFADALARAARSGEGAAVLCIDLDHFKSVNDTLGHNHGDLLLGMAAQRLQRCVREGDT
ncbi:MAG: diguanylate cyclase, partial [Caulobacterales bacterium]|nr:diguanylate cyclase [Caulobacterales bacterium]